MVVSLAPSANGWGYRPHLDGLRAVAVYLVVLFHAGFGSFEGGFVGVDLFFVLSGFLVTNVILSDLAEHGTLRLSRFYARRARRLIPAAAVTVMGTALVAVLVAAPLDRAELVDDGRAASLWYANWHFLGEANDYFNADDAESPFLHFWSLAIEEQFYLLFPVLLLGVWKLAGHQIGRTIGAFAGLLTIGVGLQLFWAGRDANRAYLGTDARFYQLLVGVVLALVLWRHRVPERFAEAARVVFPLSVAALVLVGTSWAAVGASVRGLIAAAFSGLIILAAEVARGGRFASVLGSQPVRYLGGISYGTYLWHWPVIILIDRVVDASPFALFVFSATIGTALAALSNELVERPIRTTRRLDGRPQIAIGVGIAVAVASGLVVAPTLLDNDRRPVVSASGSGVVGVTALPDIDWDTLDLEPPPVPTCDAADGSDCIIVDGDGPTMLLVGDSHARMYIPALEEIAARRGIRLAVAFAQACPWMRDSYAGPLDESATQRCVEMRTRTYDSIIPSLDPDIVVAVGRANTIGRLGRLGTTREDLAGSPPEELYPALAETTVDEWVADGRRVVLIQPIAEFEQGSQDPVACLSGAQFTEQCAFPALLSEVEERFMRAAARGNEFVSTIDLDGLKCPGLVICPPIIDDIVVNRDQSHLSNDFVRHITDEIEQQMVASSVFDAS